MALTPFSPLFPLTPFLITAQPSGPSGLFKKVLYLVCFVSEKDLAEEEQHRTQVHVKKDYDIVEAINFFKESTFWKRYVNDVIKATFWKRSSISYMDYNK